MTSLQIFGGLLIAIFSFHLNHKIKKVVDIKILINSLFELYGQEDSFTQYNAKEVNTQLMHEILTIEKMHDCNYYIKKQVDKLTQLRLLYFNYDTSKPIKEELVKINYKKLGGGFIIFTLLNLNLEFIINK